MECNRSNFMELDISSTYERYANAKPSAIENSRLRPPGQDLFDYLMEDKESVRLADEMIREAGFAW